MGRPKLLGTLDARRFINQHRGIIYGTMLGDASILNWGSHAALRILHAEDQKELVMHKYDLLREVVFKAPRSYPHSKWGQPKWYFYTACDIEWQKVWSIFHQNSRVEVIGKTRHHYKVVTPQVLKEVTDQGFAWWIMDDGSYTYGHQTKYPGKALFCFRLSTEGYTYWENELIVDWLKERYGVFATINPANKRLKDGTPRTYYFVRIGWREFEKIVPRVEPFIIPSLRYKIGFPQDKGQLALVEELKTRSEHHGNVVNQPETTDRRHEGKVVCAGQ